MFRIFRLRGARLTAFSLICVLIFVAVCAVALRMGGPDTVTIRGDSYALRAEGEEDILAFLSACGYTSSEQISQLDVTVPEIWNDAYLRYSELQRAQGLDLTPYKGDQAQELVYALDDGRYAVLLTAAHRIIAAHLSARDGSSVMEPLIPADDNSL